MTSALGIDERFEAASSGPDPRRWGVLGVMCLALLVVGIDGTIVNVALPTMVRELGATSTQLQWIVDSYTIIFASFLLIAGNTGDRLGRKRCFIIGLAIFTSGSVGCAFVDSASTLILWRGVQGFGAAFVMPATLSIITNVFRDEAERTRAIALWAGTSGLGVAIGPLVGGFLLEHFWWGSIFLVNLPIAVITIIAALLIVPESRDAHPTKLDLIGTVLSTLGIVAVLFAIIEGPSRGWGDPLIVGCFVAGAILLTAFVFWERHTVDPILDISFFKEPRFSAASIAVTLVFFAMFGSLFFVSQYLQFVLGYTALESGVRLLPIAAVLMVSAPLSAKLVGRVGTKLVVAGGLGLVAVALWLFSLTTVDSGYGHVALVLVIVGAGMGLAMAPATDSIMGSLPPAKAGVGSAMNDTTREIGGALGVAILGSVATATYVASITSNPDFAALQAASPEAADAIKSSVGAASVVAESLPPQLADAVTLAANQAFVDAIGRGTIVGAVVALLGGIVALVFLPARPHHAGVDDTTEDLIDSAARRLGEDPAARQSLAGITLGLLADAGMSSLTYNAVAARSGVGTATLERLWTSRTDAVADALKETFAAHPVPHGPDLRSDVRAYLVDLRDLLAVPRSRQVLGALVAEATSDPDLAAALRERVTGPRRDELKARLNEQPEALRVPVEIALDQLVGPLYYRALVAGEPVDDSAIDSLVASVFVA